MSARAKPIIIKSPGPLNEAVEVFRGGGIIAYPTETFYALGVDPFNAEAIKKLFLLKGRPEKNPVSVIVKDVDMLAMVVEDVPPMAEALIKKFWPGPLTIIFKALSTVPPMLTANTGKIGVRVSSSPICINLTAALSSPITATSANPSGKTPPITAGEVLDYFNGRVDLLIDGGTLTGRLGSTIVDATGERILVLREGEVPTGEILGSIQD